jgi:transketolase
VAVRPGRRAGESPFDHTIWVLASDGDIQEGVTSEASSWAGHQQLGNLVLVYDANHISIEGDTDVAMSEDTAKRYEAYGWHVQTVDWTNGKGGQASADGDYTEDVDALYAALVAAREDRSRPSLVVLRTIIAWPAPDAQNTGTAHGAALGDDEVKATKKLLGVDPEATFAVDDEVLRHARAVGDRGAEVHAEWERDFEKWKADHPERAEFWARLTERRLPDGWTDALPTFEAGKDLATRKASGAVLNALAPVLPELWGGSADLAESNNTSMKGEASFVPEEWQTNMWQGGPYGRTLHFGIREHAMGSILNGIALHGGTRPYGATFLVFSDYMRPAVRLAALSKMPVTYVWTHDSIGLGEDGPTHQPVEHLAALRAIPGLDVVRPADANETTSPGARSWSTPTARRASCCRGRTCRPGHGTRTVSPPPTGWREVPMSCSRRARGTAEPDVVLIGTGSEVQLAVVARELLAVKAYMRGSCRCPAASGSTPRTRTTATACCRRPSVPGSAWRRPWHRAGARSSATRAAASLSSTTGRRPTTRPSTRSSGSPRRPSPRRPATALRPHADRSMTGYRGGTP